MIQNYFIKTFLRYCVFTFLLLSQNNKIAAQFSQPLQLIYGGTALTGSIDIEVKIADKNPASKITVTSFSSNKIEADVSKYKTPVLIVEFSNLRFDAPKSLLKKLSVNIVTPSIPKGFAQNLRTIYGPLKINEKRVYSYEIDAADTILAGKLTFTFSAIVIEKRSFKIAGNSFQLFLNIIPPPLYPINVTEKELWQLASKLKTVEAYKIYIDRFPKGKSVRDAKRKQLYLIENPYSDIPTKNTSNTPIFFKDENAEWKKTKKANKIDAYNTYLKDFPNGKYAQKAKSTVKSLSSSLDTLILKSTEDELKGRMIYHIADTMTIGQTYRVRLEISADTSSHFIEKLIASVEEYSDHPEDLNNEIIQIGKTMHAHLEGIDPDVENNFNIRLFGESNEREVNLYSGKPTIWEWNVKPLEEGRHPLYFTIEIVKIKDGVETQEVLPVYDSKITILSLSIFQSYKIQFISGGIISVLVLVILVLFFKKKKAITDDIDLEKLIKTDPLQGATALIERDQIKDALNLLDRFLKNKDAEFLKEIILLKSRLASNDGKLNKAIINKETASTERNNIKLAILDIIERSKAVD